MKKITTILLLLPFLSCSKNKDEIGWLKDQSVLHKYQLWVDSYSQDTTRLQRRTLLWESKLPASKNGGCDTLSDLFFTDCTRFELIHYYYCSDNKKIQQLYLGRFPDGKLPVFIDTVFENYNAARMRSHMDYYMNYHMYPHMINKF